VPDTWRDLVDLCRLRPLLATALEADRYQLDESRTIALDLATVVATKASRYLAVAALLTLGQDKEMAAQARPRGQSHHRHQGRPRHEIRVIKRRADLRQIVQQSHMRGVLPARRR
jgi:hypothetical protein